MPDYWGRLCGVVSPCGSLPLRQYRAPLGGFVGSGPGFLEVHEVRQRFSGLGVPGWFSL